MNPYLIMNEKLVELFEYNFFYNEKLIHLMEPEQNRLPEKVFQLFNHILSAHRVWNARILSEPAIHPWERRPFEDLIGINSKNHHETLQILENPNLETFISYQNTGGTNFQNKLEDILFHVINHSTYHRGQIAMLFRESGLTPMVSDFIAYKR